MFEAIAGVYCLTNIVNGHMYIGSSANIDGRIGCHEHMLLNGAHDNSHLQRAFDKYGVDAFEYSVLVICDISMLLYYEQQFLDQWKPEYNICPIAGSVRGATWKLSDDTKRKLSKAATGRKLSDSAKAKIADANRKRVWSEESKRKMAKHVSESLKGIKRSEEHCRHLSESLRGKPSPMKGKKFPKEFGEKVAEANRRRVWSEESRRRQSDSQKRRQLLEHSEGGNCHE